MNSIDLRRIDLNLLVVFQALMQEGNVTRAAVKLSLSQSAVSAALSRLRKLFGDPLFERSRTGVLPTWRALEISARLAPTLASIADVIFEEPEFEPTSSTRVIHLAMSDDIEIVLAPWLAQRKAERGWTVEFAIHQTNSTLWESSVANDRTDIALAMPPTHISSTFQSETLFSSGYLCLYNADLLAVSNPITAEEYVNADHIRVSYDVQRGWVDDLMAARGHKRKTLCAISHFSGLAALLPTTPAIATFPAYAARALARVTGLTLSPVPIQAPQFAIAAIWSTQSDGSSENVWIRRILAEFAQSI
ncbi:LysR substrate-binding domain-containing protein [Leucobacter tardus]|uniref:LysR family transcriptional regulator n=1 Tax=Leucobacter tardus TaxID=501483 RepID=A0A939TTX3_9MICO|nr:LysR family transcriptional regulator [Leucobacter tardus]MBO2989160.1 LysR family transcriptional regulator [Leucobacter tardus]